MIPQYTGYADNKNGVHESYIYNVAEMCVYGIHTSVLYRTKLYYFGMVISNFEPLHPTPTLCACAYVHARAYKRPVGLSVVLQAIGHGCGLLSDYIVYHRPI